MKKALLLGLISIASISLCFAQAQKPEEQTEADKLFEQGYDLNNRGNYDEAIDVLKKAVQADPEHVRAQVYLGVALMGKEEFADAIAQLQKALVLDEKYPLTNYALAVCYARKKDPDVAEARKYVTVAKESGYHVPPWFFDYLKRLESGNLPPQKPEKNEENPQK